MQAYSLASRCIFIIFNLRVILNHSISQIPKRKGEPLPESSKMKNLSWLMWKVSVEGLLMGFSIWIYSVHMYLWLGFLWVPCLSIATFPKQSSLLAIASNNGWSWMEGGTHTQTHTNLRFVSMAADPVFCLQIQTQLQRFFVFEVMTGCEEEAELPLYNSSQAPDKT